jgi:hypothetical protein
MKGTLFAPPAAVAAFTGATAGAFLAIEAAIAVTAVAGAIAESAPRETGAMA